MHAQVHCNQEETTEWTEHWSVLTLKTENYDEIVVIFHVYWFIVGMAEIL